MAKKLRILDDVIGQENVVKWFKSCLKRDKLPQVVLLVGPPGIGKTSIAKIVACEVACMNNPGLLESTKDAIIDKDTSTDCVKLYNMSNLKSQEAVHEVKSDLSIGFSATGRKVIIMDEAHGMSDEAQDSLLTTFESLPLGVYVLICTTETESFRDAFVSRCVRQLLKNLSQSQMRKFLRDRINDNGLKFAVSQEMVLSMLCSYTNREPRRAINLLDSLDNKEVVSVEDLEAFFNVNQSKQLITLIGYLFAGDILHGLSYIEDLDIDSTFNKTLLEILKVAEGGQSYLLNRDASLHVKSLISEYGINPLIGFIIDCTTSRRLSQNALSGFFLKWCTKEESFKPKSVDSEKVKIEDIGLMSSMLEKNEVQFSNNREVQVMSLEQLLEGCDTIDD